VRKQLKKKLNKFENWVRFDSLPQVMVSGFNRHKKLVQAMKKKL